MAIVLAILKWIGIVLGGVLGLALLFGVLVVFVPVRYRLSGSYQFRVSWLCRIVSVGKRINSDAIWLRLLGIPVVRLAGDSPGKKERASAGATGTDRGAGEEKAGSEEPESRPQSGKPGGNHDAGHAQTGKKKSIPKGESGTGDPASTGLLIGGISLLPFAYREGIVITPDFDDRVFAADGMIKGQIRILYFIRLCIRLYRDKELRKLWNKIQKLKKEAA